MSTYSDLEFDYAAGNYALVELASKDEGAGKEIKIYPA